MWHLKASDGFEHQIPIESAARTQAVLDHLASGCLECGEALGWLSRQGFHRRLHGLPSPPDHAVEAAKDAFAFSTSRWRLKDL